MSERVLVTGADGFIGSHLVEALVKRGYQVRALVHYNSLGSWGWLDSVPADVQANIDVVLGDVRDNNGLKTAMRNCETVFHLAALVAIPYSYQSPEAYIETNVRGTLNVVQAARDLSLKKVVHTSTSEVYGTSQYTPIDESHPLQAQSPYSASKIGADQIAWSYHASFGTPVSIIRPFNTYGPRQSARAVIPTIITQIASGMPCVHLGALHPTRDFNFVSDTVEGFIAVAESEASIGEVINIGSGFEISIGDVARLIADLMGVNIEIQTDSQRLRPRASEVERLLASNEKAGRLIDWAPKFRALAGLREGLRVTVDWFADPGNIRLYRAETYNI